MAVHPCDSLVGEVLAQVVVLIVRWLDRVQILIGRGSYCEVSPARKPSTTAASLLVDLVAG